MSGGVDLRGDANRRQGWCHRREGIGLLMRGDRGCERGGN